MSDVQLKGRQAEHELALTAEAHASFKAKCLEEATELAKLGKKDEAYTKLLMVVAIDGVRAVIHGHVDTATIEREAAKAREETGQKPN